MEELGHMREWARALSEAGTVCFMVGDTLYFRYKGDLKRFTSVAHLNTWLLAHQWCG